ncbi:MAG TPA: hypothetical protein VLS25_05835 [Dehalococcoidia bacterium]|nr:hypothetical protein [Dehalococcoidia bacterium]
MTRSPEPQLSLLCSGRDHEHHRTGQVATLHDISRHPHSRDGSHARTVHGGST